MAELNEHMLHGMRDRPDSLKSLGCGTQYPFYHKSTTLFQQNNIFQCW